MRFYRAFLLDALSSYCESRAGMEPVLYLADADDMEAMRELVAREVSGCAGIEIRPQRGADLGERLHNAFAEAFDDGCTAACAVGADHPTLPTARPGEAFVLLRDHDLVLGPADDGGYYLIGMKSARAALFMDLPYSTPSLFRETVSRAGAEHLDLALLPEWYDVDDAASFRRMARDRELLRPGGRTREMLETFEGAGGRIIATDAGDA